MHLSFFGPEPAFVNEPLHKGMVDADLAEGAVLEPVGTGIADMGQGQTVAVQEQGGDRGAHAGKLRTGGHQFGEQGVGRLDLVRKDGQRLVFMDIAVQMDQIQHGGSRGDVAARVAAHSVGNHGEIAPDIGGIVILEADHSDVGACCVFEDQSHGQGLNSMTVLPMRMGTPGSTGRARVSWLPPR